MTDVLIIGAGAAGLSAARVLSNAGKSILILEARDRIGGRIHTIKGDGFSFPVDAGAEFIHGELPHTKALMKEAGVPYFAGAGRTWNIKGNRLSEGDLFDDSWNELIEKLQVLKEDMTIGQFLNLHFDEAKYVPLRDAVKKFVEGYDAADVSKASALALKKEWSNENIEGYRPTGGYSQLMDFLLSETLHYKGQWVAAAMVKRIVWKKNDVEVITDKNQKFKARKILITIPVPVLKSGMIEFDPPLTREFKALHDIEVGGVIKFLVEFRDRIWESGAGVRHMPGLNFLFSDAQVPTWWTQNPNKIPLLTGWLAGPVVDKSPMDDEELLRIAFQSLCYLFDATEKQIKKEVRAIKIINWHADPFSMGAYAYSTLKTVAAIDTLSRPVEDTVYFAGEALYKGAEMGTVEAALASGNDTAAKIIRTIG